MTAPTNPYPALARAIDPNVVQSIRQASRATSTDFGLLMAQAAQESSFKPNAKAANGSASGLFQFIDSTWLDMVKRFGAKYGVGQLAQQIAPDASGKLTVADPATRKKILDLRQDPSLSASLAGEYDHMNQTQVEQAMGHPLQRADLYMAHFLGAGGATTLLKAVETKGNTVAADILPEAAASNQSIFYDSQTGRARTVGEIYNSLASKIETSAAALGGGSASLPSTSIAASAANALAPGGDPIASAFAASSLGSSVDWSGVKLSPQMMSMLNVVALAALKMSDEDSSANEAQPTAPPDPILHGRRSI
jgi:hypothetical protein